MRQQCCHPSLVKDLASFTTASKPGKKEEEDLCESMNNLLLTDINKTIGSVSANPAEFLSSKLRLFFGQMDRMLSVNQNVCKADLSRAVVVSQWTSFLDIVSFERTPRLHLECDLHTGALAWHTDSCQSPS